MVAVVAVAVVAGAALMPQSMRADALGATASVISFVLFIPQALVVWRSRRDPHALIGVSLETQLLILANATIWGLYAFAEQAFWVGAPGLVNGPLAVAVIILVLRSRRVQPPSDSAEDSCPNCGALGEHLILITTPAGAGSVVDCHPHSAIAGVPVAAHY